MALSCLHFNYNTTDYCDGTYEQCAKQVTCPNNEVGHHCFVVWQVNETDNVPTPISAGCNPPYASALDEKCGNECVGQPRGPRYYCCCSKDNCNKNFRLPPPQTSHLEVPKQVLFEPKPTPDVLWSVIVPVVIIVIIVTLIGTYIFGRRKRGFFGKLLYGDGANSTTANSTNRRNNNNNDLTARELNELRNNNDTSILTPFRNAFGVGGGNSNSNNNNVTGGNHHILTNNKMTNHHDATSTPNNINQQQAGEINRIDLSRIKLLEVIGTGRFGTVHRASLLNNNNNNTNTNTNDTTSEIAVKIISPSDHQSWLNEQCVYNLPRIGHPNILKFLYSDEHLETESYWLIVEYARKGSLYSYLKQQTVNWREFLQIALGIVHGLAHLHELDVAHLDLKSKNVLLKDDLTPCITDFGVATGSYMDHRRKYLQVGTPRYMAPEVLECSVTFTKASFTKIDVYALSLVLWELLSRCYPLPKPMQHTATSMNHATYLLGTTAYIPNSYHLQQQQQQQNYPPLPMYYGDQTTSPPPNQVSHQLSNNNNQPAIIPAHLNQALTVSCCETTVPPPPQLEQQPNQQSNSENNDDDSQTPFKQEAGKEVVAENDTVVAGEVNGEIVSQQALNDNIMQQQQVVDAPPPYKLPFEDIAGPTPDINTMRQIVVVDKMRPKLRDEWRIYPTSQFCRAIEDGWEYDHDARISASCFVERVESLPQCID